MYGSRIVLADRWLASSKICSRCRGVLEALALSGGERDCRSCGAHHDRDVKAAKNLKNLAVSSGAGLWRDWPRLELKDRGETRLVEAGTQPRRYPCVASSKSGKTASGLSLLSAL
jgi:transposase